jgi:hypothetical protein
MQGINLHEYIALNESHMNYSPSTKTKELISKRLSGNKQSSINDPNSSLHLQQINSQHDISDNHNNAMISVISDQL